MSSNQEPPNADDHPSPSPPTDASADGRLCRCETSLIELLDVTTDGILIHRELRYIYANPAALKLLGRTHDEVVGHSPFELVPPRYRLLLAERIMQSYVSRVALPEVEERLLHASGTEVPVEVVTIPIVFQGELSTLVHIRNITVRRELEVRLRARDRLVSAGLVAAGVAHEISNPLTYALANLKLLEKRIAEMAHRAPEIQVMLSSVADGIERAAHAARDVRVFTGSQRVKPTRVDIHHVLDSCVAFLDPDLRSRVNILKHYGDVPPVLGSEARLAQVFLNLLTNAVQSMGEQLRGAHDIDIRTSSKDSFVRIEVADTGIGIPPELQSAIFEPLFTTKPHGTGLGLALCKELVEEEQGELSVSSVVGKGTTFTVILRAASRAAPPPLHRHDRTFGKRILVVDDEPRLAATLKMILSSHDTTLAKSGHEALQYLHAGKAFDLIVCDVLMDQIDGIELYKRVREESPGLEARMLFLTGDAFISRTQEFLEQIPNRHLQKPFNPDELLDLVDDVLAPPT